MSRDTQMPPGQEEADISDCRVCRISDTLLECMVDKECSHALAFGNGKFCIHPLSHQITKLRHTDS